MSWEIEPIGPTKESAPLSSSEIIQQESKDSGISTIEASKLVAALLVPLICVPLLPPPKDDKQTVDDLSAIMNQSQNVTFAFVQEMTQQMNAATQEIANKWGDNIRELAESLKKITSSPEFQALEELKKGDPSKGESTGRLTAQATSAISNTSEGVRPVHENLSVTLDHLEKLGQNPNHNMTAYTLLFSVAGGMALGAVNPSDTAVPTIERLVEYVQPMTPQLSVQDLIPVINLMVMAPIFYRFLDEAISNVKNKAPQDTQKMVHHFAKDVIKMVGDPTFALLSVVNQSEKVNQLNPEQKRELLAIIKLILASIALSLLYSLEVGKLKGDQFMGMEIKEFRALLKGEIKLSEKEDKMTEQNLMTRTLIRQIQFLLNDELIHVPDQVKEQFIEGLFEFLGESQKLDQLIDPAKDFSKVLNKALETMDFKIPLPKILYG